MKILSAMQIENYFEDAKGMGIIGRGENLDACFSHLARNMFALMQDVEQVHLIQIITFEFTEDNNDRALQTWLTMLLEKSREHPLMFGDFRLKREGSVWRATVSGERVRHDIKRTIDVKRIVPTLTVVHKVEHRWEARCVVVI